MVKYTEDYEYKRVTKMEMICPECGCYVQVFGEDHQAELHQRRHHGHVVHCPGSDKLIPGDKVRKHTSLALVKNDKGRYFNPR